eukprot:GILK01003567.1.p1 GENE.GILK01003567.1~~GILK01003567.1.p1  ORF type:complete len:448 (-),score=69.17 GILK01003567.1:144-1487(-)
MHGRRLADKKVPTAEERAEELAKLAKCNTLMKSLLDRRKRGVVDESSFDVTQKMLEINPDFNTLWNYRRDILNSFFVSKTADEKEAMLLNELQLLERAFRKHPKCYAAWHYRKWVLQQVKDPKVLQRELALCKAFLDKDDRNFHVWNFRQWVVALIGLDPKVELQFTTDRIQKNFSNYSAWHYRSKYLAAVHAKGAEQPKGDTVSLPLDVIRSELELVRNGVYTEPDDQCCWLYLRWLLWQESEVPDELVPDVESQIAVCDELIESEEKILRWAMLTKAFLLTLLKRDLQQVVAIYDKMIEADPVHSSYYSDARSIPILQQKLADVPVDVRSLDLSNNGLTVVHGRLLSSFTALEELNLSGNALTRWSGLSCLTSLQVLNVDNNALTSLDGISAIPTLKRLSARHNNINKLPGEPVKCQLLSLELSGNFVCDAEHYNEQLRKAFPSL